MSGKNLRKNKISKNNQSTTTAIVADAADAVLPNATVNDPDENEKDMLDMTQRVMRKRKEHLHDHYHNVKRSKAVLSSDDDDNEDDRSKETAKSPIQELAKDDFDNGIKKDGMKNSRVNGSIDGLSLNISLTTSLGGSQSASTPVNAGKRLELNRSVLMRKTIRSDESSTGKRSNETFDENDCDSSSSFTHMDQNTCGTSQQIKNTTMLTNKHSKNRHVTSNQSSDIFSQTTVNAKVPYVSQSTITLGTSTINKDMNSNLTQCSNDFRVDRSLICTSVANDEPVVNRSLTNTNLQWRPVDIKNTLEYRELEKKNRSLSSKIDTLKEVLSKERKERKKMNQTHILKPRASFWNELSIFMESHGHVYQGDGRTLHQIGHELGLTDLMVQSVQRDADKPDKVAMNIWRKICPSIDEKVFVKSIKRVPISTLENIYAFARLSHPKSSLDYKKMRNDIAANIRQGNLSHRSHGALLVNELNDGDNDDPHDDDDDEKNESNDAVNDMQSRVRTNETIDDSSEEEEEEEEEED